MSIDTDAGSSETAQSMDQLQFLLTVEHALIVEYLSVCCALGHDLRAEDGGPATQSARDAAIAANGLADAQMLRVLAPYAPQRARAVRYVELSGFRKPRFGPRFSPRDYRAM